MLFLRSMVLWYAAYVRPLLDVALLSFLLYKTYEILVKTQAVQLVKGAFSILVLYALVFVLKLETLLWILNATAPGVAISITIVFQPELRKIFLKIGKKNWLRQRECAHHTHIDAVLTAADVLSKRKRGMLVVFARHHTVREVSETGTALYARLSSSLLVTIFGHDTPMHDGAVIVRDGLVVSAGSFLPLSEQHDIRKTFGTRHRAALGMAEKTDAITLVVSEETGALSLAYDSKLYYDLPHADVLAQLKQLLETTTRAGHAQGTLDHGRSTLS